MNTFKKLSFCLFLFLISCNPAKKAIYDNAGYKDISYEKKYDEISDTYYYLTLVKHKDKKGKVLKLQLAHANKETGETVVEFSERMGNPMLAINASTMYKLKDKKIKPHGVQIINGKIAQDREYFGYTIGFGENNVLKAFKPGIQAQEVLDAGVTNALGSFMPIIENHKSVDDSVIDVAKHGFKKHPRQVIAQFDNLDLLILSCGGRGFDGTGMTAKDMIRILSKIDVKFAFNLDGGGSVATVIDGKRITKMIDKNGTKDRLRPNFLYIFRN